VGGIALWGKSLMPGLMKQFDARLGYGVIFTVGLNAWFLKIGVHFSKYCEQVHRMAVAIAKTLWNGLKSRLGTAVVFVSMPSPVHFIKFNQNN
jgi:hypothetical protein